MTIIEVCVDDCAGVAAARAAGADRVEVCSQLDVGGLTPSLTMVAAAQPEAPPGGCQVIIRPRKGNFIYSASEIDDMLASIASFREESEKRANCPPLGFVVGCLDEGGVVDLPTCALLRDAVGEAPLTFHRAFDSISDRPRALEELIDLGFERILTTGGHPTRANSSALQSLVKQARHRIGIIASGGLRSHNIVQILAESDAPEVHFRAPAVEGGTDSEQLCATIRAVREYRGVPPS